MGSTIFWVVTLHFVTSIFFLVYVAMYWHMSLKYIWSNGWTLEDVTPVGGLEIPLYFIPIVNLAFTYIALRLIDELILHENVGQVISVYLCKFGIHYQEID